MVALADGRIGTGLANKGDHLLLRDSSGKLADGVSWGDDETVLSPSVAVVPPGHSIERSPPGRDTDAAADFVDNANPSPGRGIGEQAVAGAAIERQAAGSSIDIRRRRQRRRHRAISRGGSRVDCRGRRCAGRGALRRAVRQAAVPPMALTNVSRGRDHLVRPVGRKNRGEGKPLRL